MPKLRRSVGLICLMLAIAISIPLVSSAFFNTNREKTITISQEEYDRLKQFELLVEVKQYVDAYYYQEPVVQDMVDGAIQGMLGGLSDPYTFYYNEEAWQKMLEDDEGKYAGIGVQMLGNPVDSSVTITRVFRNTPAEAAGLRKGDVFYKVGELEVSTATMNEAVSYMRGIPGEKVHVEVLRNGEVLPFDLTKANIVVNRVESKMLDDSIGYIILFEFAGTSYEAFKEAYDDLKDKGMKHLIFDLRDNPGGWVGDAERIGNIFLDEKLLYYTQDRFGRRKDFITDKGQDDMPLTILVNENSASASEILTAALQDYHRAQLVGTKTFGKGVIQFVIPLTSGNTGFQVTNAQYFSPDGDKVHKEGILPDVILEMPEELASKMFETGDLADPQLAKAYELARNQVQ